MTEYTRLRQQKCAVTLCARTSTETVNHPQRGPVDVCIQHARNIRAIQGKPIFSEAAR